MYESLGFENLTAPQAAIGLGLILGLLFGALAEVTRFCLRRAVAGDTGERRSAAGVWAIALAAAVAGTQLAILSGLLDFSAHRFFLAELPIAAIIIGGLMFGAGMVLTRGCVSRLTVLAGSGNLRAVFVLLVFAITAHATLKGVLAPLRTTLGSLTVPLGETISLAALPGGAPLWSAVLVVAALVVAWRSGAKPAHLGLAILLGLLVPAGWVGTGFVLYDDFDPIALESLSFTSPAADALFWTIASTSIPAGFGTGLVGGVFAGALVLATLSRRFQWQSFENPAQTGRYASGAMLMGVGGVLAGGCTVGAGLSGVATLSFAAILALASIISGGVIAARLLSGYGTKRADAVPAE